MFQSSVSTLLILLHRPFCVIYKHTTIAYNLQNGLVGQADWSFLLF